MTRSPSGSSGCACTAARSSTSTTKWATTAGSTRCRPPCSPPSCRISRRWSAKRRENAYYDAAFAGLANAGAITTPYVAPENESIFNQYTLRVADGKRDALQAFLKERGIGTSIYYPLPLHLQPCFAYLGYKEGQCPESERAAKEVLSLPIFPELTRQQLDEVVAGVQAFFSK